LNIISRAEQTALPARAFATATASHLGFCHRLRGLFTVSGCPNSPISKLDVEPRARAYRARGAQWMPFTVANKCKSA
jgi:hypothetical protein